MTVNYLSLILLGVFLTGCQTSFSDDFENGSSLWQMTDSNAWKVKTNKNSKVLNLFGSSKYNPPHRSPYNIARFKDKNLTSFELTVDAKTTKKYYGHRDLCLFFGYQDSAHYYYVHLGEKTDNHANQIFIVNGAPRVKISTSTTKGTKWVDGQWHKIKIIRDSESGKIEIYFDDMKKTIMTATDKNFTWGQVGLGSFDDTGEFDNFLIKGSVK